MMFAIIIALIALAAGVAVIYLILKKMGEEGIEVAAPGSCKSGRCGVRCAPASDAHHEETEELAEEADRIRRKDIA